MNPIKCLRCKGSLAEIEGDVVLHGARFHRECGAIEAWEKGHRHHIRAAHKHVRAEMARKHGISDVRPIYDRLTSMSRSVCEEAGLIHAGPAGGPHDSTSTYTVLKYWYEPPVPISVPVPRSCKGWHIDRTIRALGGMLEAATLAYDNHEHGKSARRDPTPVFIGTVQGESFEVGMYASLVCSLALKTLYAIHHPKASKWVFKRMGHGLSKVWLKLEGERGRLIGIMRSMPVFTVGHGPLIEAEVRSLLGSVANFDDLRRAETNGRELIIGSSLHLRLAWAAYLRCEELTEYAQIPPQLPPSVGLVETSFHSNRRGSSQYIKQRDEATRRYRLRSLARGTTIEPEWLILSHAIRGLGRYSKDNLSKSYYGLIESSSGTYVYGSTFQMLLQWAIGNHVRYPDHGAYHTSLGDAKYLAHTLPGRLETITAQYAVSAAYYDLQTMEGKPITRYGIGELLLYTQSAVYAAELTMKWLYSITHPDAPSSLYEDEIGHDVLTAWRYISDHHDAILDMFHTMPLFQPDVDLQLHEYTSGERMVEMLGRFRTAYVDARYGITAPDKEVLIDINYRINLHLAWAVFLHGLRYLYLSPRLVSRPQAS